MARGETQPVLGLSIASIAEDGGCALLARDRDLDAILDSGLLKAACWRAPSSGR